MVSAGIICDWKTPLQASSNHCNPDLCSRHTNGHCQTIVYQRLLVVWVPEHCKINGNELTDKQMKLGSVALQPYFSLNVAVRRGIIVRGCRLDTFQHQRLRNVYIPSPDDRREADLSKTDKTNLIRFRSGHYFGAGST